jgi:LPXTG-motif cell wall-anchored protein
MRKLLLLVLIAVSLVESKAQQPDSAQVRVDSATIALNYLSAHPIQTFVKETSDNLIDKQLFILSVFVLAGLLAAGTAGFLFYRRKKIQGRAGLTSRFYLEKKIEDLGAELAKMTKENEGLSRVIKEYNGIQHEFDSLRHGMNKVYKVRFYPGKKIQGVLDTESAVAGYAYENFLKPLMTLADSNKNQPAKISVTDQKKILELLVSLALLYTEYLYLRIGELSIGGNMVERISQFRQKGRPNSQLLKKLDLQNGSRALVIKMLLEKHGITELSYPVFDETNLNNQ